MLSLAPDSAPPVGGIFYLKSHISRTHSVYYGDKHHRSGIVLHQVEQWTVVSRRRPLGRATMLQDVYPGSLRHTTGRSVGEDHALRYISDHNAVEIPVAFTLDSDSSWRLKRTTIPTV